MNPPKLIGDVFSFGGVDYHHWNQIVNVPCRNFADLVAAIPTSEKQLIRIFGVPSYKGKFLDCDGDEMGHKDDSYWKLEGCILSTTRRRSTMVSVHFPVGSTEAYAYAVVRKLSETK